MWKVGKGQERKQNIPFEILLEDGTFCRDADIVLQKWKSSFEALSNPLDADTTSSADDKPTISEGNTGSVLNSSKTREEVITAMNVTCFDTGITPDIWKQSIISPVPKSSTSDPRDPLQYRGIYLAPVVYKMYGYILNGRLSECENGILHDAQNGFRRGRSTIDHISVLTSSTVIR